jgi:alpha-glucosidase
VLDVFVARGHWPTWVLSNHDNPRHRTRYRAGLPEAEADARSERRARCAAVMLCTLPGTPFLYAGEELGLDDAVLPDTARVDPGGRDGCRAPLPWLAAEGHGWSSDVAPWLPFPPDAAARSVESERSDEASMLHLYRRLLAHRRASVELHSGGCRLLAAPPGVLAYERFAPDEPGQIVLVNFSDQAAPSDELLEGGAAGRRVVLSSDGAGEGQPFGDTLAGESAVVLAVG